jgi:glycerol-3-phosphate acyltransferase PlsX
LTVDKKTIIALDAMGGDYAPAETVKGAVSAVNSDYNVIVNLFGDEEKICKELANYTYDNNRVIITHSGSVIETSEQPVKAIKSKRDSSLVMGLYAVKNGEADGLVSCGNTGALLVGGQTIIGRLPDIERAALAFTVPSMTVPVMIIDCGANADARPEMLLNFARMASVYRKNIDGVENPRVGIVNIGEEEEKGNVLVKETFPLLRECESINFVGSVEARGLAEGSVDVAVCDAFVGNIILKTYEGVSSFLLRQLKGVLLSSPKTKLGALLINKDLKATLKKFSHEEYGGAPMLGLKAPVFKTHGTSKSVEIKNSILQCKAYIEAGVTGKIADSITNG